MKTVTSGGATLSGDRRRHALIEQYDVLHTPPSPDLQAMVDLAAQVCGVPTAAINLVTDTHQHAIATTGFPPSVCAREDSLCAAVIEDRSTVSAADASRDVRFRDNPFVTGEIGRVRFYASAPLTTPDGLTIGRLCVFDRVPRTLDHRQRTALETLAERVVDVLDLRLRSRQLEQSLTELTAVRDELRRSNDQLALFAGQVSHDLRTPLSAIMASTEMLSTAPTITGDPEVEPLVVAALDASRRMAGLIDGVLGHATFGARLVKSDVDLDAMVETVRHDLTPALAESSGVIRSTRLPVVRADPHQLYSVVLNLVSNAVKFARPGVPPQVTITSETLPDRWRVIVTDNGRGIAREHQREVFTLFSRVEHSIDGTGIGLTTAKRIIEVHGGVLRLESRTGAGTTVIFELPRP